MVSSAPPPAIDDTTGDRDSSTVLNALVGGVAGVVRSFVPLSPVPGVRSPGTSRTERRETGYASARSPASSR